jgi:hypothetical protein
MEQGDSALVSFRSGVRSDNIEHLDLGLDSQELVRIRKKGFCYFSLQMYQSTLTVWKCVKDAERRWSGFERIPAQSTFFLQDQTLW